MVLQDAFPKRRVQQLEDDLVSAMENERSQLKHHCPLRICAFSIGQERERAAWKRASVVRRGERCQERVAAAAVSIPGLPARSRGVAGEEHAPAARRSDESARYDQPTSVVCAVRYQLIDGAHRIVVQN
eukprot:2769163-Rhodomonas_salina.2